jgi:tryptophan synthase alpha chain
MKKIQLMTHIVAGYPTMDECEKIALKMASSGVSFIEIQIPFSDPIADGKTILSANMQALKNGTTPDDCFALMKRLKKSIKIPLLFMTYFNIPFVYGLEKFCKKAKEVGCYGFIIPDIPLDEEEHEHYLELCKKYDLKAIQVISPITESERLKKIAQVAEGFVYCVSRLGTTGERAELDSRLGDYLDKVREHIDLPLALGFGISTQEHVQAAAAKADIVVMGSKIINLYNETKENKVDAIGDFVLKMKSA